MVSGGCEVRSAPVKSLGREPTWLLLILSFPPNLLCYKPQGRKCVQRPWGRAVWALCGPYGDG